MICFRNLYIITGLAFCAALSLGILAIRLPAGINSIYIDIYCAASTAITWLFLFLLRRFRHSHKLPKHCWFVNRGVLVDPVICMLVIFPFNPAVSQELRQQAFFYSGRILEQLDLPEPEERY